MIKPTIDISTFADKLSVAVGEELKEAAEPLIQDCLKKIEDRLRQRLAAMVVGQIKHQYELSKNVNYLVIRVHLGDPE